MTVDSITREVLIAASRERVWALLTEAEHLGRWFGDAGAEIELSPGGILRLQWVEHGTVLGRIEVVEPYERFAFRWAPFGEPAGLEPGIGTATLVDFTLAAEGRGTRLRVVESGFSALDCADPRRAELFTGNTEGWAIEIGELVDYAGRVTV